MNDDPGSRIVLTLVEAEHERGTDGAILYDEELDVVSYRRVHELVDEDEQEIVADLLSDEDARGQAIVVHRRPDGRRNVWLIPKRFIAELGRTTSAILLDQREIPVWKTLREAGRLAITQ